MQTNAVKSVLAVFGACLSVQAGAAQTAVRQICPEFDRGAQQLSVRVSTGCMTGMARFKEHNLALKVDHERAHIALSGGIRFHPITSPVVTADCAGAQNFTVSAKDVQPRRYTLSYAGEPLGTVDLLEGAEPPACIGIKGSKHRLQPKPVDPGSFSDWAFDHQGGWREWRGASITALLEPLLGSAPESLEGRPEIEIRMEKRLWQRDRRKPGGGPRQPFMAVSITRHGLGDDSVSGDRYFVAVVRGEDGWRVEKLWRQQMCARGQNAGQWKSAPCP
jgi:hypothetical protein